MMKKFFGVVIVKNSDWSRCPLSEKFLEKYNNVESIFKNYDFYTIDLVKKMDKNKYKIIEHQYIRILNKGKQDEHICVFRMIWNDNNEVDDILTYIVPEDKMNLSYEEMYQLAFND